MDIIVKKLPESKIEMSITLSWEEWQGEMGHAVEHLGKDVKVAGFRPGKVPRDVIEKRFGKEALLIEAAEHAISHSYPKALKEKKIEAIGRPEMKLGKAVQGEPLEYSAVTAVMPEATLGSWRDAVKKANKVFAKQPETIEEKEIDAELERLASIRANLSSSASISFSSIVSGCLAKTLFAFFTASRQDPSVASGITAVTALYSSGSPCTAFPSFISGRPIASIFFSLSALGYECEMACSAASIKSASLPKRFSITSRGTLPGRNPATFTSFPRCSTACPISPCHSSHDKVIDISIFDSGNFLTIISIVRLIFNNQFPVFNQ